MALITSSKQTNKPQLRQSSKNVGFWEGQRLAKQRAYEKQAKKKKIKLADLCIFTQQLSSMLDAGLPLVSALTALEEQTEQPVFKIIIREVRSDVSTGTSFSEATKKFPRAFPNLFTSMVEAGEASGNLGGILGKVAAYFEASVRLAKKVKSALVYPAVVITLALVLVQVLLIFVIPVFKEMFEGFGKELPKFTQMVIDLSDFLKANIIFFIIGIVALVVAIKKIIVTPSGRRMKDKILRKAPVFGNLLQKIALSRFCRTYSILLTSGVPLLRSLEIVSNSSGNTFIEDACKDITRSVSQGGMLSEAVAENDYFTPSVKHMARAGEQTGNVEGMMNKIADFFDNEIDNIVAALTSLMEPVLIVFLGTVIGGLVIAMFLPIFNLAGAVS
ncbi:MAG: type II secretion system F family protein [Opitutales bacterium]|nr:type II secretion system F family protein [Opitutales bacterium]